VDEHIVPRLTRDEAEALLCVEELHGTCRHCTSILYGPVRATGSS
jgi:hypothetical protein